MKVIYKKTIKDKIDKEIDEGKLIERIELTNDEFDSFLKEVFINTNWLVCLNGDKSMYSFNYTNEEYRQLISKINVAYTEGDNYSGSYIKYRNVCVQTHEDY